MSDSIREQLLKLGLKPLPKPAHHPAQGRPPSGKPQAGQRPGAGGKPPSGKPHGGHGTGKPHAKPHAGQAPSGKPAHGKPAQGKPNAPRQTREEMDLARAYALRAQAERAEAEAAKRAAEEKARQKRERKEKLAALLAGQELNVADADQPRHFEHRAKIRRVYVTEAQMQAVNAGELGIVQLEARYLVVPRLIAEQVRDLAPDMVAVLLEPGEASVDELVLDGGTPAAGQASTGDTPAA